MENYPPPVFKNKSWFSAIWILPFVAAVFGGYMLYDYYQNRGLQITIVFANGQGLEAGKTRIRYEGINIGRVEKIELNQGVKKVKVSARLDKSAATLAREGTLFWVVKPNLAPGRISGLETIISGRYIVLHPSGSDKVQTEFIGLDEALAGDKSLPGLHLVLNAARLGSLSPGTPVLHRQIEVGRVETHRLAHDDHGVDVQIYIYPQFAHLVKTTSRFWNVGGITVTGSLSGIKIRSESLMALIAGGVAFDTPVDDPGELAVNEMIYSLFADKESAVSGVLADEEERFRPGLLVRVRFKNAEGIELGKTLVKFKGITIGKVIDHTVSDDMSDVVLTIMLSSEAVSAACDGAQYWIVKPRLGAGGFTGIGTIFSGRYIEVRPGTGARQIEFVGLDSPPLSSPDKAGLNIVLTCSDPGSLSLGSPVYYRHIEAGKVTGIALGEGGDHVHVHVHIFKKYSQLVNKASRFWNAGGVTVKATIAGVKIHTESLESLLTGGIGFETPAGIDAGAVRNGEEFTLFTDEEAARSWGRLIYIVFDDAADLSEGAILQYKGIKVGSVQQIALNRTMDGIQVTVRLLPSYGNIAQKGSRFWVVKPRVGLRGVANLGAIVRGNYIAVLPGDGPMANEFAGLAAPPLGQPNDLHLTLAAATLGGLEKGSPVLSRHMEVGQVEDYRLAEDGRQALIDIVIHAPFIKLVGSETSFWRAPGLKVEASLRGVVVQMDSMAALLVGGIALDNLSGEPGDPVPAGHQFPLYEKMQDATSTMVRYREFILAAKQLGSLGPGKPVYYRGVEVGKILNVALGATAQHVRIRVGIEENYAQLVRPGSKFWNAGGIGVDFSLLKGAKVRTQSLEAILSGGVAFATPEEGDGGKELSADFVFYLHDKPRNDWLDWMPNIHLGP